MDKKNNLKGKLIYKIITSITLLVPLPLYLFLMATLFNITADYTVFTTIDNVEVIEYEDYFFLITKDNANILGLVEYKNDIYGITISDEDIIKIDKNYYSYTLKDDVMQLVDVKKLELQKQQSYKVPLTFFISLFGVLIVILIIQGKMQWHKKHPRAATLVALLTGTIILFILNAVIGNILGVFAVATGSWAVYCLEYLVNQGMLDDKQKDKKENEILKALKGMLD